MSDPRRALKLAAAREALNEVESGMSLGLGSGSTAEEFVRLLGDLVQRGELKNLRTVSTSSKTEELARSFGIAVTTLAQEDMLDLAVDGADEIDAQLRLIKGLGGALLREKIVEQSSKRFIVIADDSKLVERLGQGKLPVEVVTFASAHLFKRFATFGLSPAYRMKGESHFVTDEGHHIIDVRLPPARAVEDVVGELRWIAGVVETGFFPHEATEAIIASDEGVRRIKR